jgi:uncharacterized protein
MLRDFQRISGTDEDYLFFPESTHLYTIEKAHAASVDACCAGAEPPSESLAGILVEEEALMRMAMEKAQSCLTVPVTDSLCLYMAHDCNLACSYCYNDGGRVVQAPPLMSPAVIEAAFRRYFIESGKTYAVSFYGGEPLLGFKAMKQAIEIGEALERERGVRIHYSMTTNGTLLNREILAFVDRHIDSVTISLDGPCDVNNSHRTPKKEGECWNAHDRTVANLYELRRHTRAKLALKATLAGDMAARCEESVNYLEGLGAGVVLMTPANVPAGSPAEMGEAAWDAYTRTQVSWVRRFFSGGEGVIPALAHKGIWNALSTLLTAKRPCHYCGAGQNPAITADGAVWACHGLISSPDYLMGSVLDESSGRERELRRRFYDLDVRRRQECRNCWARYLCGGGCYARAVADNGEVEQPNRRHCESTRRIAEALVAGFAETMADPPRRMRLLHEAGKRFARAGAR